LKKLSFLLVLTFFSILSINNLYSQREHIDKNDVVLIGRGTIGKQNILKKLNIENNYLTHIGIGFLENDNLIVYHVSVDKVVEGSSLIKENYDTFISEDGLFYVAIWSVNLNFIEKNKIIEIIKKIEKEKVVFDKNYSLYNEPNELYCSEFVVKVFNKIRNDYFLPTSTSEINDVLIKSMIEDKEYYPVDFFINDKSFEIIYEFCI